MSSTRASATRSFRGAAKEDGAISVMGSAGARGWRPGTLIGSFEQLCMRAESRGVIALPAASFARSVKPIIPKLAGRQPTHAYRLAEEVTITTCGGSKLVKHDLFDIFNVAAHRSF